MKQITIYDLIEDAELALKSNAHFSALSLTFAIISACACVEYPDEWFDENAEDDEYLRKHFPSHYPNERYNCKNHDRERFQMWIDDWENSHNCNESLKPKMQEYEKKKEEDRNSPNGITPRINGELLYQLRCVLFHEASADIEFDNEKKIADEGNRNISKDMFTLTLDAENPINMYAEGCYATFSIGASSMDINVNGLIHRYLKLAKLYIKEHPDKNFKVIKVHDYRKDNK